MAYAGNQKIIKLGRLGYMTDLSQADIPPDALIRCENASFRHGIVERSDEITDWMYGNPSFQTPDFEDEKPLAVKRYYPAPRIERHIVVTDKGRVYKYTNAYNRIEITPTGLAPEILSVDSMPVIVTGGSQDQNDEKKVFIFTGNSPIQVIEGDGETRRNLTTPSPDWSTTFPTFGLIFRNRLVCFGNKSNPHQQYFSAPDNQENFSPIDVGVLIQNIFPGENEGLISAFVYKGKLFSFKKPYGVYMLVDDAADSASWYYQRTSGTFGIASPMSFFETTDDVFIMSNDGSLVSMTAAFRLGDVYNADLLAALKNATGFQQLVRRQFLYNSFGAYLPNQKLAIMAFPSFKSKDGYCDSLVSIDFNNDIPRISWHHYSESEFTSVDKYKDSFGDDRFLFSKLNFDGSEYLSGRMATYYPSFSEQTPFRIQTPHLNFETEANKLFDGFELMFESTSTYPLAVDVYIDSKFSKTFLIQPYFGSVLGPTLFANITKFSNFLMKLGKSFLLGRGTRPKYNSLQGRGQSISFLIRDGITIEAPYDGDPLPDDEMGGLYPVKISGIRVYYRLAGQDQKSQNN